MAPVASDPAEARKRRKEIIQSQRADGEGVLATNNENLLESSSCTSVPEGVLTDAEKKPPKKRKVDNNTENGNSKKKTQIRYDPEVPMNKEQLAAWRREARRVRNRESAAASRQRIRNRISELEDEVGEWKTKYAQAMQRLNGLQQSIADDAVSNS